MIALAAAAFTAQVAIADLKNAVAKVELTAAPIADGPVRLCSMRSEPARHVRGLPLAPDDDTCFVAFAQGGRLRARYEVDLGEMADSSGDPDDAAQVDGGVIFSLQALLMLAERGESELVIDLSLPPGASLAAPFAAEPDRPTRFRTTTGQARDGAYFAVGQLRQLGQIGAGASSLRVVAVGPQPAASDQGLLRWLTPAFIASADFWRAMPRGMLALLVPSRRSDRAGLFGSVLHDRMPSAVLWFGAGAKDADFAADWLAFHELFHLGQPAVSPRLPWFSEGTASYYDIVLRARSGAAGAAEMWRELSADLREQCGDRGTPLAEESRALRKTHRYRRVYLRGACAALQLDVAIRTRSGGARSLDDVLRRLAAGSRAAPLDEDEILRALDAVSAGLATKLVRGAMPPIEEILAIDPALRAAIFAPR